MRLATIEGYKILSTDLGNFMNINNDFKEYTTHSDEFGGVEYSLINYGFYYSSILNIRGSLVNYLANLTLNDETPTPMFTVFGHVNYDLYSMTSFFSMDSLDYNFTDVNVRYEIADSNIINWKHNKTFNTMTSGGCTSIFVRNRFLSDVVEKYAPSAINQTETTLVIYKTNPIIQKALRPFTNQVR